MSSASVSCVCSEAGRGAPRASERERSDPANPKKGGWVWEGVWWGGCRTIGAKAPSGEKRVATKQQRDRETEREERKGWGGEKAAGTMALQLQVQWQKPSVCVFECVCREGFLFLC